MKRNRTKKDWESLIQEQENSGLSAFAFCQQKGINPSFFYQKRKSIEKSHSSEPFVNLDSSSGDRRCLCQAITLVKIGPFEIRPGHNIDQKNLSKIFFSVLEVVNAQL